MPDLQGKPRRRKDASPRRLFSVKEQLRGKLGYEGFEALYTQLLGVTVEPKRKRRPRRRKAAA